MCHQIKQISSQKFTLDRSVSMAAIGYLISAVLTKEHLGKKRTLAKFQIDNSKTEGLARVYTDKQTDMAKSLIIHTHIYFRGVSTFWKHE